VIGEIRRIQSNRPHKVLCFERIEMEEDGRIELRLGYYLIGKKPRSKGKWVWGQFAPLMPPEDFNYLVQKAKKQGWF